MPDASSGQSRKEPLKTLTDVFGQFLQTKRPWIAQARARGGHRLPCARAWAEAAGGGGAGLRDSAACLVLAGHRSPFLSVTAPSWPAEAGAGWIAGGPYGSTSL